MAVGDYSGKIHLYYLNADSQPTAQKILHWHAHLVHAMAFTKDGSYLVSGGDEAVLVIWQITTGEKEYYFLKLYLIVYNWCLFFFFFFELFRFLPRLGNPITQVSISNDMKYYGVLFADSSVKIINTLSMKTEREVVQTFKRGGDKWHGKLILEPTSGNVVMNGRGPVLQFYNAHTDRYVRELEVSVVCKKCEEKNSLMLEGFLFF